ncbi:MAG TPA: hypothetical protein VFQ61_08810 [Polyangiaceae bacterium]|nr:hypothetical protein [Polyangiaceae bacterium]
MSLGTLCCIREAAAERSDLDPTIGYNYGEVETAHTAGVAAAQRAGSNSVSALFLNPANIAVGRVYHVTAFAHVLPEAQRQTYGAAATDSVSSPIHLAGAAGVTYNLQDSSGIKRRYTDVRFALAFPFSDRFFVGLGGRYLMLRQNGDGPLGDSLASGGLSGLNIVRAFSLDAGTTFKPTPEISLALVGTGLENAGHGFLPTTLGSGVAYGRREFSLEGDLVFDFTTWQETRLRAQTGLDLLLADHYGVRAGYRFDQGAESHALSLGAGYIDRAFAFDLALRRTVAGATSTSIMAGFVVHLDNVGLSPSPSETF